MTAQLFIIKYFTFLTIKSIITIDGYILSYKFENVKQKEIL